MSTLICPLSVLVVVCVLASGCAGPYQERCVSERTFENEHRIMIHKDYYPCRRVIIYYDKDSGEETVYGERP